MKIKHIKPSALWRRFWNNDIVRTAAGVFFGLGAFWGVQEAVYLWI